MARIIKVTFRDLQCFKVEADTPVYEIAKLAQNYYNYPIMCAKMDNEIVGVDCPVNHKCKIDFYDRTNSIGNNVYANSVHMMMIVALKRVLGIDVEVYIQNSIDNGVCCEVLDPKVKLDKDVVKKIEKEMDHIVKDKLLFTSVAVRRMDAIKFFNRAKQSDKAKVLKYMTTSYVTLYRLDEHYDYFFSSLAYSTADIPDYRLTYVKDNCFVLGIPTVYNPDVALPYKHVTIVFDTFHEYNQWGRKIGIEDTSDLNRFVSEGRAKEVIRMAELHYEAQLHDISEKIWDLRDTVKIVLLAGPSSSGKTTSAKKLSCYLQSIGFNAITLSTDDYFLEKGETPRDENGEYDFESIHAIDLKLFNDQMNELLKGKKVLVPEYNFIEGKKEFKKRWLQLGPKDILVVEGLHCLNEELTSSIPRKNKYKIFIGPFTQLNIDNHNRIHTSDTRRLRRIIRDNRTRGYGAAQTLAMWYKIREGEIKYIYPFERDADAIINSALIYELGVLKTYVEPLLMCVDEDDPMYPEALRLTKFLRNLMPIPSDDIPRDSVLREFIGGSGFYNN